MERNYTYKLTIIRDAKVSSATSNHTKDFNSLFDIVEEFKSDVDIIEQNTTWEFILYGVFEFEDAPGFKDKITLNVSYYSSKGEYYYNLQRGNYSFNFSGRDLVVLFSEEYDQFCKQLNTKDINKIISVVRANCPNSILQLNNDPRKYFTDSFSKAVTKIDLRQDTAEFILYKDSSAGEDCICIPNKVTLNSNDEFVFDGRYKNYGWIVEINRIWFIRTIAFALTLIKYKEKYPSRKIELWY